jgi:hypothetical protein
VKIPNCMLECVAIIRAPEACPSFTSTHRFNRAGKTHPARTPLSSPRAASSRVSHRQQPPVDDAGTK